MAYFLDFDERALKEWRKLGSTVREQLKKKLVEVLESPRIEANKGFVNGMVASHLLCHSGTINRHSLNGALLS